MAAIAIMVEGGTGPPHSTFRTVVLGVWVRIVVVVVVLVSIAAAVAVVVLEDGAPVLRAVRTQVEVVLNAVTVGVRVLVEIVTAVGVQIDMLAHIAGWA